MVSSPAVEPKVSRPSRKSLCLSRTNYEVSRLSAIRPTMGVRHTTTIVVRLAAEVSSCQAS